MIRLLGLLSCLFALFLLPMNLRLFSDALVVSNGSGAWIMFSGMILLTLSSGWVGLKYFRKA